MREITLNGIKYPVTASFGALCQLQDELKTDNILEVFSRFDPAQNKLDYRTAAIMFWLGMKSHKPAMTLDQTFKILDSAQPHEQFAQLMEVVAEFADGFTQTLPQADTVEENAKNVTNPA